MILGCKNSETAEYFDSKLTPIDEVILLFVDRHLIMSLWILIKVWTIECLNSGSQNSETEGNLDSKVTPIDDVIVFLVVRHFDDVTMDNNIGMDN